MATQTENAVAGPSTISTPSQAVTQTQPALKGYNYEGDMEDAHLQKRYYIYVPSTMLAATPMAMTIGFIIGARRGAVKARLRFLAENAHRAPTTVQGWYFYTKTRNYRVFFAMCKTGARYAAGFGAAVLLFTTTEEYFGYLREKYFPQPSDKAVTPRNPKWYSWRKESAHLEEGMLAGSLLTLGAGLAFRLPNPLLVRGVLVGLTLGTVFSGGLMALDKMAYKIKLRKEAEEAAAAHEDNQKAAALTDEEVEKMREEASLAGSSITDQAASMGWIDWAMFKAGLKDGKEGQEGQEGSN